MIFLICTATIATGSYNIMELEQIFGLGRWQVLSNLAMTMKYKPLEAHFEYLTSNVMGPFNPV